MDGADRRARSRLRRRALGAVVAAAFAVGSGFGGGIIPEADIAELERLGVRKIFTPGASMAEIVEWVRANVGQTV